MKDSKETLLAYIKKETGWPDAQCEEYYAQMQREELDKEIAVKKMKKFDNELDFIKSLTPAQEKFFLDHTSKREKFYDKREKALEKAANKWMDKYKKYEEMIESIQNIIEDV
jgi:hypothetical protein